MRGTRFRSIGLRGPLWALVSPAGNEKPRVPGPSAPHWAQCAGRPGPQPHLPASLAAPDGVLESPLPSEAPRSCSGAAHRARAVSKKRTRLLPQGGARDAPIGGRAGSSRPLDDALPVTPPAPLPWCRRIDLSSPVLGASLASGDFMEKEEEECSVRHPHGRDFAGPQASVSPPVELAVWPRGQGWGALLSYILTRILALPLTRCLILGKSQRGAEPQLLLSNGDNSPHVAAACL